ncbi:MAG: usg protein [Alphaproteobacteria bacterium]|nr:usg protein [Alphaproteobacteria bacterium]
MEKTGFFDDITPHRESDFERQLRGYRLTTAEILYHMPDHPSVLQSYLWQEYDIAPKFPQLKRFLDFWSRNLDGPLHSVKVTAAGIVTPAEWRHVDCESRLQ